MTSCSSQTQLLYRSQLLPSMFTGPVASGVQLGGSFVTPTSFSLQTLVSCRAAGQLRTPFTGSGSTGDMAAFRSARKRPASARRAATALVAYPRIADTPAATRNPAPTSGSGTHRAAARDASAACRPPLLPAAAAAAAASASSVGATRAPLTRVHGMSARQTARE